MEIKKQTVSKTEELSITFERVAPAETIKLLSVLGSSFATKAQRTRNKEERATREKFAAAMLSAAAYIQECEKKNPRGGNIIED